MGDALVSALVKELVGRLTSVALEEFGLIRGLEYDILSLKKDYEQIEAVLQDAEEKSIKERAVELWLRDLRLASLMVENVLDEVSTEVLLQRLHKKRVKFRVRAFFSSNHNKFMSRVKIAHKVKDIRRTLDDIAMASKRFELKLTPSGAISHVDDIGVACEMPHRETSSLIHDSSIILGRDQEIEMLTEKICNKNTGKHDNSEIPVYAIWGMGGLGKTTLAQLVYNHERVNKYFELRSWVYVSKNFQVKGKRFLVVLDDVWIEEDEKAKWDELSKTLSCGTEGSIVLMTTRYNTTSRMMAKVGELQHELGCLSQDDSWLLFKKFAFEGKEEAAISELDPIGREIVEKCNGLPLALKTLGSLMWSKSSTREWEHVNDDIVWNLEESKVLPALKLSYDNLLPHLKRCFAYCCLFPKGYELEKNVLIPLWLSNGFIPPRGEISPYYLGEEIFNSLVWRSFFQVDKVEKYKMHDLMHDMARHVMGDDCLVVEPGKKVIIQNEVLHLTSSCTDFLFSPEELRKVTSLRSILMLGKIDTCITQVFNHMYIRVLYLTGVKLKTLPTSLCKLKHVRYLNLSDSWIKVLPESIIYLQNLQVLILSYCEKLCKLPEGLGYMTNLQHLDINNCDSLLHLPLGIKKLTSLRILSTVPFGNKSGAKIEELENLNLLEGKLLIKGLENVGGLSEAGSANLKSKKNLSVLELWWSERPSSHPEMFAYDEAVLQGLEPNLWLKVLAIFNYMGNTISPSWMLKLSNLVEIILHDCENCLCFPALGRLPNLKVIKMEKMKSLKCFHDEENNSLGDTTNAFLSLQILDIHRCPSLVSLPCSLPRLEVLHIRYCYKLASLPSNIPNIRDFCLNRCDGLVSLPGNLPNITKLFLNECDGLLSLPDEIQSFKGLKELEIWNCKHLFKRYNEKTGEDWAKVSHIPKVIIYNGDRELFLRVRYYEERLNISMQHLLL